jgi:hypothetical protein
MSGGNLSEKAKSYIQKRQISELFQALMTGLMFNQPEDHIDFIIKSLNTIKEKKIQQVNWNTFIPAEGTRRKNENLTNNNVGNKIFFCC